MREAYTAVLVRAEPWSGTSYTEPYEVGWAGEAVLFVRAIEAAGVGGARLMTCISPDGIHWVDEGTALTLPDSPGGIAFAKLSGFGHHLRFRADLPEQASAKYVVTLALKE